MEEVLDIKWREFVYEIAELTVKQFMSIAIRYNLRQSVLSRH
jgi:hypothetical protein